MGIRLHKVIGYGLADLKVEKKKIADPRVTDTHVTNDNLHEDEDKSSITAYGKWLKKHVEAGVEDPENEDLDHIERWIARTKKSERYTDDWYGTVVKSFPEVDNSWWSEGVICITPLTYRKEWQHYDDSIDYALNQERSVKSRGHGTEQSVRVLRLNPFPFEGRYRDLRTGEELESFKAGRIHSLARRGETSEADTAANHLFGFENYADFDANTNILVPESVRTLAAWMDLFTDPNQWMRLKPMILTYWS